MIGIVLTVAVLVVALMVQRSYPALAGVIAVIPLKILATSFAAYQGGTLKASIGGMLIGQFVWGMVLAVVWWML